MVATIDLTHPEARDWMQRKPTRIGEEPDREPTGLDSVLEMCEFRQQNQIPHIIGEEYDFWEDMCIMIENTHSRGKFDESGRKV